MKVSFKSGQCGGGILETDELYSEPNEPSSVSFQVELIYRDLNAVYFDIHDIMGKQENALYCLGKFFRFTHFQLPVSGNASLSVDRKSQIGRFRKLLDTRYLS